MADMMSTLRGILGEGADDKIKNAMNMLGYSGDCAADIHDKITEEKIPLVRAWMEKVGEL